MRDAFTAEMTALLDSEPTTVLLLADISVAAFEAARTTHPLRVINVGIREQLLVGAAGGMALTGLRPVVHTYAPFLVARPFEQLKLDLGHQGVGAVLVSIGASYDVAAAGRTHHAPEDVALLDTLSGWSIHVPGHADEAARLVRGAVQGEGRHYVRLSERSNTTAMPPTDGRFHVVRTGAAGTVIAVGPTLDPVIEAVKGVDVTVLYATTLRPFDGTGLRAALSTPAVVLVEPYLEGTSARCVSAVLHDVPHRLLSLGVGRAEVRRYGTAADHDRLHGVDVGGLRHSITRFLGEDVRTGL